MLPVGSKVFFAGGVTGDQSVTNVIDIYDVNTDEWTTEFLSDPRGFIAAIAYDDKVYFAGGAKPYNVTSTIIEVYNVTSGEWEEPMYLQTTRLVNALRVENSLRFFREPIELCKSYRTYKSQTSKWRN